MLYCVTICYTVLRCVILCYIVLPCVTLCYIVIHCVTLCYVVLHCVIHCSTKEGLTAGNKACKPTLARSDNGSFQQPT